jgi:PAS domain S-box-containing protein
MASSGAVERGRAEQMFHAVLESAADALVIVESDGRIGLINGRAEQLLGYHREEIAGQFADMLVPARFRSQHHDVRAGYLALPRAGPTGAPEEKLALRKDGSELAVEIDLGPIETADGTLVIATIRDLTERKRVGTEVRESSQRRSDVLTKLSHDLRTPLNAIMGLAGLMQMGKAGPVTAAQHEYLGDILTSSDDLLRLIDGVLELARLDAARAALGQADAGAVV